MEFGRSSSAPATPSSRRRARARTPRRCPPTPTRPAGSSGASTPARTPTSFRGRTLDRERTAPRSAAERAAAARGQLAAVQWPPERVSALRLGINVGVPLMMAQRNRDVARSNVRPLSLLSDFKWQRALRAQRLDGLAQEIWRVQAKFLEVGLLMAIASQVKALGAYPSKVDVWCRLPPCLPGQGQGGRSRTGLAAAATLRGPTRSPRGSTRCSDSARDRPSSRPR